MQTLSMQQIRTEAEEQHYREFQRLALDRARCGETEALAGMLRQGLPLNLCDHHGNSLLLLACYRGRIETARMLLKSGADVDLRNSRGQTPLGGVAFKGHLKIAELLLWHGADIHADNGGGMTSVMFASVFGRSSMVSLLEQHGAALIPIHSLSIQTRLLLFLAPLIRLFVPRT
ncbi:MAG: ankyrin repeat domain-containing protein [bacterium]